MLRLSDGENCIMIPRERVEMVYLNGDNIVVQTDNHAACLRCKDLSVDAVDSLADYLKGTAGESVYLEGERLDLQLRPNLNVQASPAHGLVLKP